jgi:hypothetical protein
MVPSPAFRRFVPALHQIGRVGPGMSASVMKGKAKAQFMATMSNEALESDAKKKRASCSVMCSEIVNQKPRDWSKLCAAKKSKRGTEKMNYLVKHLKIFLSTLPILAALILGLMCLAPLPPGQHGGPCSEVAPGVWRQEDPATGELTKPCSPTVVCGECVRDPSSPTGCSWECSYQGARYTGPSRHPCTCPISPAPTLTPSPTAGGSVSGGCPSPEPGCYFNGTECNWGFWESCTYCCPGRSYTVSLGFGSCFGKWNALPCR